MLKSKLEIKYYGDPVLNKVSSKIDSITDEIKELAEEMKKAMYEYDGIGLAAPQIGLNKKLITINLPADYIQNNNSLTPGEALLIPRMPIVCINPEIISFGTEMSTTDEGCLSVPEIYAPVTRPTTITVQTQLISEEIINVECGGFLARVFQHEIDHLAGKLYIDRLDPDNYKKIKRKLDKLKKKLIKKRGF